MDEIGNTIKEVQVLRREFEGLSAALDHLVRMGVASSKIVQAKPGDVVVLTTPAHLSEDQYDAIQDAARSINAFSGCEVVVLDGGMDINVYRCEEDGGDE